MTLLKRLSHIARARLGDVRSGGGDAGVEDFDASPPPRPTPKERARSLPPEVRRAYAALEVSPGAGRADVKAAYRRLQKAYHTDRFANDPDKAKTAHIVSRELNLAYETLTDYLDNR